MTISLDIAVIQGTWQRRNMIRYFLLLATRR
jgi:hypothetical protein